MIRQIRSIRPICVLMENLRESALFIRANLRETQKAA
jgi:hypothetical protein